MGTFIKHGKVIKPDYQLVTADKAEETANTDQHHKRILPLRLLLKTPDPDVAGVWLDSDDEVEAIEPCLPQLTVIAIHFPTFNDGRGYSSASILRHRYAFKGELRAIGDVRLDQLEQMVRCGFDAFELAQGQDAHLAIQKLAGFPSSYQNVADRVPLFRNR